MNSQIDPEILQIFFDETRQTLDDLESGLLSIERRTLHGPELKAKFDEVFRYAHNFKGASAAVGFEQLAVLAHAIEDLLTLLKEEHIEPTQERLSVLFKSLDILRKTLNGIIQNPDHKEYTDDIINELRAALLEAPQSPKPSESARTSQTLPMKDSEASRKPSIPTQASNSAQNPSSEERSIRVNTVKLDGLLNLVGELVVNQSMMISHRVNGTTQSNHAIQTLTYIEKIVLELQTLAMTLRMVPIKPLFQKMTRIVRDVSVQLGKEVRFTLEGDHVELDKIVLERVTDPLTHIIRNAIDHGLEKTEARLSAGKSLFGNVHLTAQQQDDKILIRVQDDGKGLDPDALKSKAIEKGLIDETQAAQMSEEEAWNLVFLPGFSTKDTITDISGRGVGMDVVQRAVTELKGDIRIHSKKAQGTTFEIALPLSLSIIPGLIVQVDQENYVIPVSHLVEIIELQKFEIQTSTQRGKMINLRGEVIPVFSLSDLLHGKNRTRKMGGQGPFESREYRPAIVSRRKGKKFACEVDSVIGQQQIVIKKLGQEFQSKPGILGGAVLSDGEPSMILDLNQLPGLGMVGLQPQKNAAELSQPEKNTSDHSIEGHLHDAIRSA
jgi:two-component system chemotaxis sensor kinase CheA